MIDNNKVNNKGNNKANKIFIEPDEEIIFVLEKINNSDSDRVILIVPSTSVLISSAVSLKILSRQLLKTPKIAVIVTDNEGSFGLGERAYLVICKKVSDINKEIWVKASNYKKKLEDEMNLIKKRLLNEREEVVEDVNDNEKVSQDVVKAMIVEEVKEEILPIVEKSRLKPKVIDIGNFKIFAGGDINENIDLIELERDRKKTEKVVNLKDSSTLRGESIEMDNRNPGLIGQDVTEQLNSAGPTFSNRTRNSSGTFFKNISIFFSNIFKHISIKKFLIGFFVSFILFFIVSLLFFNSVDIQIKMSENKISVSKSIIAKTDILSIDVANLSIPANEITKVNTLSSEAETSGKGYKGEYASGSISIINTSNKPVTIKANTLISLNSNPTLKYKLVEDVTIDALKSDTKTIKAENFGDEYNLKDTLKDFTIAGYSDMAVSNITQLTGGTKTEIKVLSKEDIEALKATMIEQLKSDLLNSIKGLLSEDDVILTGSEKFTEDTFTTDIKENEEAEKFTADLKMTLTALRITKTDIKSLLSESLIIEMSVAKVQLGTPVIENVVIKDKTGTFDVRVNASTANDIDIDKLKEEIKGKNVNDVKEYIKNISGVERVTVRYSPSYIPLSMQTIPTDSSKITLTKISTLQ